MKKQLLSMICLALLAGLLTGCGDSSEDTKFTIDMESEMETTTESLETSVKTQPATTTYATTTTKITTTTKATTEAPTESPEEMVENAMIQKIMNDDAWQEFSTSYVNASFAYCDVYFWFQDLNMDGTPEFIVGPMVSGAHAAHDFEVYTYQNDALKPFFDYDRTTLHPSPNVKGEQLIGEAAFNYRLYKRNDGGYLWLSENEDGVATESWYILEAIEIDAQHKVQQQGSVLTIVENAEGKTYRGYSDEITRDEVLHNYDAETSNLQYCDISRKSFLYTDYLNNNETARKSMLKQSYEAWSYVPKDRMVYPFEEKIAEIRAEAEASTVDNSNSSDVDIQNWINIAKQHGTPYSIHMLFPTSEGMRLCVADMAMGGTEALYDGNENNITLNNSLGGCVCLYYNGTDYEMFSNTSGDGTRYVTLAYPGSDDYYEERIFDPETNSLRIGVHTKNGEPISESEFNEVYERYRAGSVLFGENGVRVTDPDILYYFHDGTYDTYQMN